MKKEISELGLAAGESVFLHVFAALDGSTPLASFASNSGAMVAGYEGLVTGIDYQEIQGRNVTKLIEDQIVNYKNAAGEPQQLVIAKKGDMPKAPVLIFDKGARTMTLGLLQQGQKKTTIRIGNNTKTAVDLTFDDIKGFVGKKFKCTDYFRDSDNVIRRYGVDPNTNKSVVTSENPANCYAIEIS